PRGRPARGPRRPRRCDSVGRGHALCAPPLGARARRAGRRRAPARRGLHAGTNCRRAPRGLPSGPRTPLMNLLVLCPHFAPDVAPTGEVMTSIATALAERGHRLHIVTSLPWYREHAVEPGWGGRPWRTERTEWGRITRLHPFPTDKTNIPARAVAFAGFTGFAAVTALTTRVRPDAVMVMSPPLPLGLAGWLSARTRRAPFLFNVQYVYHDCGVALGGLYESPVTSAYPGLLS